jgi:2,3,4,5-tetrahydropyridine-2-carboxylate N-succinyltransferase
MAEGKKGGSNVPPYSKWKPGSRIFEYHDKMLLKRLRRKRSSRCSVHLQDMDRLFRAIMMPSYVNIGAYVDAGTMVDTRATVGSVLKVGKDVHLLVV